MNKTLLRALPVAGIFALIIAIVAIFSITNTHTPVAGLEDANTVVYSFDATEGDFKGKTIEITKGELYQYLRYSSSFNSVISKYIDQEVLKNGDTNYFAAVKSNDENMEEIRLTVRQAVTGSYKEDADISSKMTHKALIKAAKQLSDNIYTAQGIRITVAETVTNNIDYVDALVNQILGHDALFENYALSYAKKLFAKDILGEWNVEDKYEDQDNPLYLEADEIAEKAEAIFNNEKTGKNTAYGIYVDFSSKADFANAIEKVAAAVTTNNVNKFSIESDQLVYDLNGTKTALTETNMKALTSAEALEVKTAVLYLYAHLYDFKYENTRHAGQNFSLVSLVGTVNLTDAKAAAEALEGKIKGANSLWYKVTKSGHPKAGVENAACGELKKTEVCLNYLAIDSYTASALSSYYNDYLFNKDMTLGVLNPSNGRDKTPFTTEGTRYFASTRTIAYNFLVDDSAKDEKYSDLSETKKQEFIAKVRENMFDSTLSSSYISEKYTEALEKVSVVIFDKLVQKSFANSNSFLSTSKETSKTHVFKIGNKEFTPTDLYNELSVIAAPNALLAIAEEKLVYNSPLYTYFAYDTDSDKKKEIQEELKNIKISFSLADASNRSCSDIPSSYGWADYLKSCFYVSSEKELETKLKISKVQGTFSSAYFTANEYEEREDAGVHNVMDVLNVDSAEAYASLKADMIALQDNTTLLYEGISAITANHLLVSLKKTNGSDSELVVPTDAYEGNVVPAKTQQWTAEQALVAKTLLKEISIELGSTLLEDFSAVETAYSNAKFGCTLAKADCLKVTNDTTIAKFDNLFGYAKQLGLNLKKEELGSFQKGSMVDQFEKRAVSLLTPDNIELFLEGGKNSVFDTAVKTGNPVATAFGYHFIEITGVTQVANAKITQDGIDKFNIGKLANYKLDSTFINTADCASKVKVCVPTQAQLQRYNYLTNDEYLKVKLPSDVQTAIDFYFGGVKSKRLSTNMVQTYIMDSFIMNEKNNAKVNDAKMAEELNILKAIYIAKTNEYK